ncbi:DUF6318 family protein [Brachybacterium sp. YJGR34]|uniref:DUF6318 family protein n=1 Tax=Brachybacterium sp. YJGR34 TaxID=2059911 RepID=UPI000E0ABD3A|nr:DUF6318 family protein [Brachybacterium sp. YJGR34]
MSRRLLTAAACGALLLGLTACGDGSDSPVTTAPPEVDISAPSDGGGGEPSDGGGESGAGDGGGEPTAAAPDIPPPDPAEYAGMDENTAEGAEQAFRYYIAVSMWAHQTGDDSLLLEMQGPDCESCQEFNEDISTLQDHGQYWSEFQITDVSTRILSSENFDREIGYDFVTSAHTRPDEDFSGTIEAPEIEYITTGGMNWVDGRWILEGIDADWGVDVHG